ncbi:hypothetical protein K413DRAFT_3333 [Clostridium sp. ASBs410]|nr:hypothetical protein K413DRAFT_3333 [Clostridium sp. ASBs410]
MTERNFMDMCRNSRWINRKGGGALRFQVYELAAERERLCISAYFSAAF